MFDKTSVLNYWQRTQTLRLYIVIGGTALALELLLFYALINTLPGRVAIANAVAMGAGMVTSFALNARYNFGVSDKLWLRFTGFATVTGMSFITSTLLILALTGAAGLPEVIAKTLTIPVVFALQYTLNRRFTFSSSKA